MAPTVCVAEFPIAGTTISTYTRQRQRLQNNVNGIKRRAFAREQMLLLQIGTINETLLTSRKNCSWKLEHTSIIPNYSISEKREKLPTNMDEHCTRFIMAKKDLLSIVIRTIIIVRRNRILQRRVNALRAETWRFLCSVLNNPKNQQQICSEDGIVPSCTEKIVPSSGLDSTENSFHKIASIRDNCDRTNDELNSSDKSKGSSKSEFFIF